MLQEFDWVLGLPIALGYILEGIAIDYLVTMATTTWSSRNPMSVPKPILLHLKRRPQRTFIKKWMQIKTSVFKGAMVKVH